jgi:hypothetical protein
MMVGTEFISRRVKPSEQYVTLRLNINAVNFLYILSDCQVINGLIMNKAQNLFYLFDRSIMELHASNLFL